uniref:Uncharacterized protein n=1 Tax=Plectus sambesii TaxID=2011161 RepID=A0A914UZ15_9BILA
MVKPPADDKGAAAGGGKSFRSRFWNGSNTTQRNTVVQGEPLGKQFDSNRHPAPDAWLKPAEDENGDTPFSYTPFKTNTLGRESQVRGRTPQPNDAVDHRVNIQKEQMRHTGTLNRPVNANATMQRLQPPQINGGASVHRPLEGHAAPLQQQHQQPQQQQHQQHQRPSPPLTNGHN